MSEELVIKDTPLRRLANEYEKLGESAFLGNGLPTLNKDYEILKLRKKIEELELENNLLNLALWQKERHIDIAARKN